MFSKDLHSFDDAKTSCELHSASLLIINDTDEQVTVFGSHAFLRRADVSSRCFPPSSPQKWLKKQTFGKGYFWMGLTDRAEENVWRWIDGTEPTFT